MLYSILFILVGIIILFFVFRLHKKDKNWFDYNKSFEGLLGAILMILLGLITLFIGWK
jgi:hypothetical protein